MWSTYISFTLVKYYTQTKLLIILQTYLVALINLFSPLNWYVQCCTSFLEKGDSLLLCPQNKNNITCKGLSKLNIAGFQEFRLHDYYNSFLLTWGNERLPQYHKLPSTKWSTVGVPFTTKLNVNSHPARK